MSHISTLKLPQEPLKWTHTPEEVISLTKEQINEDRKFLDGIGALSEEECNFETVFHALALQDTHFSLIVEPLTFYKNVSPSKELRDASNEADALLRDYIVDASLRIDVFNAKVAAEKNIKASGKILTPEEQRLVEKMILEGKRDGLALPENEREELKILQKALSQTCLDFSKNYNEENGVISFTKEELKGVPSDVVSGYNRHSVEGSEDVYDVTFKTPDIFPLFKYAENPDVRKRAIEAYESRLDINIPLFAKMLDLRRQISKLLGYETWADYRTEVKMVKNSKNVVEFLSDLENKLRPVGLQDRKNLLALKKEEHAEKGYPFDGQFYLWDYRYYDRKFIEKSLDLDDSLVKEYFPVTVVVPVILDIYQRLLSVRFVSLETATWHPDVKAYSVWKADAKDESGFVGYTYLDLYPRESKYSHAAVWPVIPGFEKPDGTRHYPVTAMVANLAKSTPEKPALMRHDDVVTFFHEMGHVFHGLLSEVKYGRFHGTSVARDFVEAPSQMLEAWCWEPKVLEMMSSHYEKQEPLPADLIEKIIKSRYVNAGLFYLRQLFFGTFDIRVHTDKEAVDYTKFWNELRESLSLVKSGKFTAGAASFNHLAGGYDAGYYGYMYSLVFASDMYATIFKADPLDPARGDKYRRCILKPGGSREELDSLEEFLGRPPNADAFTKELFGDAAVAGSKSAGL